MSSLPVTPEQSQATCASHPVLASIGACARCGRFMCRRCATSDGRCTDCVAREQQALPDAAPRARIAAVLLMVNVGADALDSALSMAHLARGTEPSESLVLLDVLDGLVGLGQAVLFIVTVVFFLRWWHLMVRHAISRGVGVGVTPGWAVGYWFIPFANLAKPYNVARAVVSGLGVSAPLGVWWGFWIASNIASNVSARMNLSGTAGLGTAEAATVLGLLGTLLSIPAALACVQVVRRIQAGLDQPA